MSHANNGEPMWFVTGTSSGLGLALAQHILRQKHNLISISRHPKPDDSLVSLTSSPSSSTLHHIQIDLSSPDPEAIKSPVRDFLSTHPNIAIDILVNNAGMVRFGALETIHPNAVFETMNTNFYSPLWLTQSVLPRLRASSPNTALRGGKAILNVSSTQGLAADPSEVAYDASKHALEGMSKVLAAEVAPFGIRVIVANLGSFRTHFSGKGASTTSKSDSVSSGDNSDPSRSGDADGAYGGDHPVAKRIAMVAKYSSVPNAARGDVDKGASVLFDAVMRRGEVDETLERQRDWSAQKADGRGRVERLVLGSDAMPKIQGVVQQFTMEVDTCRSLVKIVNADDVE